MPVNGLVVLAWLPVSADVTSTLIRQTVIPFKSFTRAPVTEIALEPGAAVTTGVPQLVNVRFAGFAIFTSDGNVSLKATPVNREDDLFWIRYSSVDEPPAIMGVVTKVFVNIGARLSNPPILKL
ncbi:MAG: hypothetical protein Pars2KO_23300 [Parasphingorhabdus sp.]